MSTTTRPPTVQDFTEFLVEYVRTSSATNVQAVVDSLLADLDDDARDVALRAALPGVVRDAFARLRTVDEKVARTPMPAPISKRWANVRDAAESGALDTWRVNAGGVAKFLLDCNPADLRLAAEWHHVHARGHRRRADFYTRLAAAIEEHDASTARALPADVLVGVFDEQGGRP